MAVKIEEVVRENISDYTILLMASNIIESLAETTEFVPSILAYTLREVASRVKNGQ